VGFIAMNVPLLFVSIMELKRDSLRLLRKEISKAKGDESKTCLLRETLKSRYPNAMLFVIQGWDTFEASWDPESSPSYIHGAYFSKARSLKEIKRLQPKEDNPIADRYYLVQVTTQELTEATLEGRKFTPWELEGIFSSLFLELENISWTSKILMWVSKFWS
jgi:hypothetical protein